jgi:ABC-type antimicrobial peptide transport system permease subunit
MYPETYGKDMLVPRIVSLTDSITGNLRPFLVALWGAVGFVLLIACVNVCQPVSCPAASRARKEVAVRSALGASPGRLSAQFMTESLLYAVLGGALGVLLGWVGQRLLIANAPASIPRLDEIHLDGAVLLFTTAIVVTTGLAFGLYPPCAWHAAP